MKLKASKTRIYNLVREYYSNLPPLRKTDFCKAPRSRSWWLRWNQGSYSCEAYFSAVAGEAVLQTIVRSRRNVRIIPFEDLKKYDLVEEEKADEKPESTHTGA